MNVIELLLFLLPVYIANASPVMLGGGAPLDFGKNLSDGRRIFGDGKTVRGFAGGVLSGIVAGGIITFLFPLSFFSSVQAQFLAATFMSFGTLVGDAAGSFIKRRMNVDSGKPFFLDIILFLVVALLFSLPVTSSTAYTADKLAFYFALTIILHPLTNLLANRAGLKKVPW